MPTLPAVGIAAIFKNERPYILEWLAHHRLLGVERFFVADNDSNDGTTELLRSLADCGFLSYHHFPSPIDTLPQLSAYRMLLREHGDSVEWMAFIDADEFIWPMGKEPSLPAFVATMADRHPDMGALVLNWASFGSSGQLHHRPGLVVERFTWHAEPGHFIHSPIKTILRPRDFVDFSCGHNALLTPGRRHLHTNGEPRKPDPEYVDIPQKRYIRSAQTCWDGFRVNHYVVKSYQEFDQCKRTKGRVFFSRPLTQDYFLWHDLNEVQALPDPAYLVRLRAEMDGLGAALTKAGWSDRSQVLTVGAVRVPLCGRVGLVERSSEGLLIRGWCKAWQGHPIRNLVAVINGQPHEAQRFESAPLLDAHRPVPGLSRPQRYLNLQAPEDSGFLAFVPLDHTIAIDSVEIGAITAQGCLTAPLERDPPGG